MIPARLIEIRFTCITAARAIQRVRKPTPAGPLQLMPSPTPRPSAAVAYAVMVVTPLFFASNLVFGRGSVHEVAPFTLAFLRWALVALALTPFMVRERDALRRILHKELPLILFLGFLGMWACGALVYLALRWTTATNGTLIYTTSPVFIILIEALFLGGRIGLRQTAGMAVAFFGVGVILLKDSWEALSHLRLNGGDLLMLLAATSWAGYSILYRSPRLAALSNMCLFGAVAAAGAILLAPFALGEYLLGAAMPLSGHAWASIAGIVVFASLLAFSGFQFGTRRLGAPVAGVFLYLLPPYGVFLAVAFLGEAFRPFHAAGIALVMGGIVLATFPARLLKAKTRGED